MMWPMSEGFLNEKKNVMWPEHAIGGPSLSPTAQVAQAKILLYFKKKTGQPSIFLNQKNEEQSCENEGQLSFSFLTMSVHTISVVEN